MAYSSISVEGGLFPSDLLEKIATGDAEGQRPTDFGFRRAYNMANHIRAAFADADIHWQSFRRSLARSSASKTTKTRRDWMGKLVELLDYEELTLRRSSIRVAGQDYRIYATLGDSEDAPPFHIVGIDRTLDSRVPGERRSPHAVVQEYLNNSDALWGVVSNGGVTRVLRDSARVSHPTYLEFDVQGMVESSQYAEFAVMYRMLHRTRLPSEGDDPDRCLLETYFQQGIDSHSRVRERLREGVQRALITLGNGLLRHPGSDELRRRFRSGSLDAQRYYRQLLRLVYRLLFLMSAEERRLIYPPADSDEVGERREAYDRHYSVSRLRARAERYFADDEHADLWEGLKQTFRLFRQDDSARTLGMSALDGELFGPFACADIETAGCANRDLLAAALDLSTFVDEGGARRRVNYAGIDVEEFGSVYESLLDFHPQARLDSDTPFNLVSGTERKQTGSYYTPPELVRELIDSALVPVARERLAGAKTSADKERALLNLRVCDPASGSGHFLLAAARRIAHELARVRSGENEPSPTAYRAALRDVARGCIYAVDKNPLAVDLCKVALWIEAHEPGLPLSFLDHHIKRGDSLVGVMDFDALSEGIPNDAYRAATGDDRDAAKLYRERNRRERAGQLSLLSASDSPLDDLADDFGALAALEERTQADVQAKSEMYQRIRDSGWDIRTACDLWTYAFFAPLRKAGADGIELVPTTQSVRNALAGRRVDQRLRAEANAAAQTLPYFHWPLEFPEVFKRGGFDVVLGNPPWEQLQPEEIKFFGIHDPKIAELAGAQRKRAISKLPRNQPHLNELWELHRYSISSLSKFVRSSNRFELTARGKINTYAIFAETMRSLIADDGQAGMIVPSGVSTDNTTRIFFADLVSRRSLVSLYDFENRERVFPGVDSRLKFCLLTISGSGRQTPQADFAFYLRRAAQLREPERRFTLTEEDFALFNPNTRTAPIFRTRRDARIARKMYRRAGALWREARGSSPEHNPWGIGFQQMFNMTTHSGLFRTRDQMESDGWRLEGNVFTRADERYLPLYEAKLFHQYDHPLRHVRRRA